MVRGVKTVRQQRQTLKHPGGRIFHSTLQTAAKVISSEHNEVRKVAHRYICRDPGAFCQCQVDNIRSSGWWQVQQQVKNPLVHTSLLPWVLAATGAIGSAASFK
jgi:hypothetical protein